MIEPFRRRITTVRWAVLLSVAGLAGWTALALLNPETLNTLARSRLQRDLRPHEIERVARYLGSGQGFCFALPVMLWVGVLFRRIGWARALLGRLTTRWMWLGMGIVGALSCVLLRVLGPYEWYLTSLACFAMVFVSCCSLVGGLVNVRLTSNSQGASDVAAIQRILLGACAIFVAAGVWTALGFKIQGFAWGVLFPGVSLALFLRIYAITIAKSFRPAATSPARIRLWVYPVLLVTINAAYSYVLYCHMLAPPDVDVTSQAQLASWMKAGATVDDVHPYLDSTILLIKYPPALYSVTACASLLLNSDINFVLLWLWVLSLQFSSLAAYVMLVALIRSRWVACCAALLFGGAETYHLFNGGQVQELFALAFTSQLLAMLLRGVNNWRSALSAGLLLGGAVLTQTETAYPFLVAAPPLCAFLAGKTIIRRRESDFRALIYCGAAGLAALVLSAPWLGRLVGQELSSGLSQFCWVYSFTSGVFWNTKGLFYAFVLGMAAVPFLLYCKRKALILVLLAASVLLSQYHRLYALMDIHGYSLYQANNCPFGETGAFTDPYLGFISQWGVIWLDFVLVLGAIGAFAVVGASRLLAWIGVPPTRIRTLLLAACVVVTMFFRVGLKPFSSVIHLYDYRALHWLKENTDPNETLVLNPNFDVPGTNARFAAWWVGAIAERRATHARITHHEVAVRQGRLMSPSAESLLEMQGAELATWFAERSVSHVFVSSRHLPSADEWVEKMLRGGARILHEDHGAIILALSSIQDHPNRSRAVRPGSR